MANKAVFFDRDDTLIADTGYIDDPALVELLPGAAAAVASLQAAGYRIVVITNQSGIARGLLDEAALERIHAELRRQLTAGGAGVDAIYYCPFHPEGTVQPYIRESDDRKPAPGMLRQAARDMDIDLSQSWTIGDRGRDIEAGRRAGTRTIRILPQGQAPKPTDPPADFTVPDLPAAAAVILGQVG